MNQTSRVRDLFGELEVVHQQMLAAARANDWEAVAATGGRADSIQAELATHGADAVLPAEVRRELAPVIGRTLDLVRQLRELAEPARAEIAAQLTSDVQRNKLKDSYGV